jgi:thiamine kinase-like enzyme
MSGAEESEDSLRRVAQLPIWSGPVDPQPLGGGISNRNYVVEDRGRRVVARVGGDKVVHGVLRASEHAASRAAHAAGVSPAVVHAEADVLVLEFVEGTTLTPEQVRDPKNLDRLVEIVRRCHNDIPKHLRGPAAMFWVFHVVRDYAHTLVEGQSPHVPMLPSLLTRAQVLEEAVGPIDVVFGHNDMLAANFIDDGKRLWLFDWEYSGFNSPLFDLGGLASNNEFPAELTRSLLGSYFGREPDDELMRRAAAMTAASLLREAMWSMVSELHSELAFDYAAYTAENLGRFEAAFAAFQTLDHS